MEEVIYDDVDNEWHITLGYDSHRMKITTKPSSPYSNAIGSMIDSGNIEKETLREYKTFRLNGEDGAFKGVLMREVG